MEKSLHERDRVGVQDSVLLDDYTNENTFLENLRKRYKENIIYTYIGHVLVSVNPYRQLPIYGKDTIAVYQKTHLIENPPHVFAITEAAYRTLVEEHYDQCILISGESGSGKTEASKKVLEYIAAVSDNKGQVQTVKDKLLQSNPVLEAFGNAKTTRNDNSSRFGKYMDIEFNSLGNPIGGNILNYLLEKSRVVHQNNGERNFHIFYQLLLGTENDVLSKLHLTRNPEDYNYISYAEHCTENMDDAKQMTEVCKAMKILGLSIKEQNEIMAIIASVLHLGNIGVLEEKGRAVLNNTSHLKYAAELLGCKEETLYLSLTQRTILARGETVSSPLDRETAIYARDALAKAIYDRLFSWLVNRFNKSLQPEQKVNNNVIGILDIYGFEIFQKNSFEQFCINYCNEKLQQLFIELTLKSEQEEYLKEGIEWEPVEYFNNNIIINLIEEKHKGIIALLDEECLRPGDTSDITFLEKMSDKLAAHRHFISYQKAETKMKKMMGREEFTLVHYAGDVIYNVHGFLDKNNDLLFRDLREVMSKTTNSITKSVFPESELESKKRPDTAVTQFKNSLTQLMNILVSKSPSYIRCIKPNDFKQPVSFNNTLISHQVKYLGLMENLRVRRAGFAYRRNYAEFLKRYKSLCPRTWPSYNGPAKYGVEELVKHLDYKPEEFRMGKVNVVSKAETTLREASLRDDTNPEEAYCNMRKMSVYNKSLTRSQTEDLAVVQDKDRGSLTKLFIRHAKTLFSTEDAFQVRKHELACLIQSHWKGYVQRKKYQQMRQAAITIQKWTRRYMAQKECKRRKRAVQIIRNFIKGFITRSGPPSDLNRKFIQTAKQQYLLRLAKSLPKSLLDKSWPIPPLVCNEASRIIQQLHKSWLARKYRLALTPERKKQLELKVLAEKLFKGKKKNYPQSIPLPFAEDRLTDAQNLIKKPFFTTEAASGDVILYGCNVIKFDRHGYKRRNRVLFISKKHFYLVMEGDKQFKIKHKIPFETVSKLEVTSERDNFLLIRIPPQLTKDKGDVILEVPHLIEVITKIVSIINNSNVLNINTVDDGKICHSLINGKEFAIDLTLGTNGPGISKGKSGQLIVVG